MSSVVCLLLVTATSPTAGPPPANQLPAPIRALLDKADTVELYSLDGPAKMKPGKTFQGQKVLGQVTLKARKARQAVLGPLGRSFPACPNWTMVRVVINRPWLGLRIKSGNQSVDLLLNFRWGWLIARRGNESFGKYSITNAAQAPIDRALEEAKVPIAQGRIEEERPSIAKTILEKAELLELYSLEPMAPETDKGPRLHGYKVLGKTAIKDAKTRTALVGSITPTLLPDVYGDLLRTLCFIPRHAFRMRYDGGTFDVLICFQCNQIQVRWDDAKQQLMKLAKQQKWARISSTFNLEDCEAQPLLDKLLTQAKVPLAKPAHAD